MDVEGSEILPACRIFGDILIPYLQMETFKRWDKEDCAATNCRCINSMFKRQCPKDGNIGSLQRNDAGECISRRGGCKLESDLPPPRRIAKEGIKKLPIVNT